MGLRTRRVKRVISLEWGVQIYQSSLRDVFVLLHYIEAYHTLYQIQKTNETIDLKLQFLPLYTTLTSGKVRIALSCESSPNATLEEHLY